MKNVTRTCVTTLLSNPISKDLKCTALFTCTYSTLVTVPHCTQYQTLNKFFLILTCLCICLCFASVAHQQCCHCQCGLTSSCMHLCETPLAPPAAPVLLAAKLCCSITSRPTVLLMSTVMLIVCQISPDIETIHCGMDNVMYNLHQCIMHHITDGESTYLFCPHKQTDRLIIRNATHNLQFLYVQRLIV